LIILDHIAQRSEIEAIYGVHHSTSVKHSPDYEVHDEKANKIVKAVLARLDKDGDNLITQREFTNGGADGLPAFEEFGKGILGHHYGMYGLESWTCIVLTPISMSCPYYR
jgi:hypothetical protein